MSGSGGGGGGGFGDGGGDCAQLQIDAQLSSPKPAVVALIKVGDVLSVELDNMGGTTVVVVKRGNQLAGGVASPRSTRLRECLQAGHAFIATIRSVNAGQVQLRITAA